MGGGRGMGHMMGQQCQCCHRLSPSPSSSSFPSGACSGVMAFSSCWCLMNFALCIHTPLWPFCVTWAEGNMGAGACYITAPQD